MTYPLQDGEAQIGPLASEMSLPDSVLQQKRPGSGNESSMLGTVLVVDNDETVRSVVRALLEGCGLVVEEASDATLAIQKADSLKDSLSVLVTDVVMPGMSGTELAYTLGRKHQNVPVVFMSGYAAGEQLHKLFENATFLQKPFGRVTLVNAVRAGLIRGASASNRPTCGTVQ